MTSRRLFLRQSTRALAGGLLLSGLSPALLRRFSYSQTVADTIALPQVERAFFTMGTVVTISAYGQSRDQINHAITRVVHEFRRLDDLLSVFKPESEVSRINRKAGKDNTPVGNEVVTLLNQARQYNEITGGAFDVTVEPLMKLWGFRQNPFIRSSLPTDREIAQALDAVGMKNVEVDENGSSVGLLQERSKLDFGGIAVGYSVDSAVRILKEEGIDAAFINHSGDAFALGCPPGTDGWEVSIPNPLRPGELLYDLRLHDRAISTSGGYEKCVLIEGQNYGHIIHPVTGRPPDRMLSTSILAPSATAADALSTATFCMTPEEAGTHLRSLRDTELLTVQCINNKAEIRRAG